MKVAVVAAYNNQVEMTVEFLDAMQKFWPSPNQTGEPILHRMILVNGGCPAHIHHPFIFQRIDLPENKGFCPTLNAGLRSVPDDADYLFFVGNDSFPVGDDWLPRLIELQQRTGAWIVCPANDRPGMENYSHLYTRDCGDYWEADFFPSIAWLIPRERFAQIGLLDERYERTGMYADNDYCKRVRAAGGLIAVSKNILLRHLLSGEGRLLGTQGRDMKNNRIVFEDKWGIGAV